MLNVASVAAFQPGPFNSTHFAGKAFVLSYTRAIRYEAQSRGVQAYALCPESTTSSFSEKVGTETPVIAGDPKTVAEFAYRKLERNKVVIVPGFMNQVSRLIPTNLRIRLVSIFHRFVHSARSVESSDSFLWQAPAHEQCSSR